MRIENGFYYKSGLVSNDFLDLLHEIDINPKCFDCLCSHDWPVFCYEPLIVSCKLDNCVELCPIALVPLLFSDYFKDMEGSRLPSGA